MYLLGLDAGSSFVKVSVINAETGKPVASASAPAQEMKISALYPGWAEQDPRTWWQSLTDAVNSCLRSEPSLKDRIAAIGISYQMHGLVAVDHNLEVIRPSIIWCDSRAVDYGNRAYQNIGHKYCMDNLLNSPGNFTAAKLAWMKDNEAENFARIYKIMLPGDYIAMRLTGEICTTAGGLSEGVFWDFREHEVSSKVLDHFGFERDILPAIKGVFSLQGELSSDAAAAMGLKSGIPVSYRAGDQPNNAFSLKVMEPGEVAATAGTSGVLYGVTDRVQTDIRSRVNLFAHVNHSKEQKRLGMLACINGTGIMNAWVRRVAGAGLDYEEMNRMAAGVSPGSNGLKVLPFGNGAERLLENTDMGASILNLDLNTHSAEHIYRAVQEGIAFAFRYAADIMKEAGTDISLIRAGKANMFLSPLFSQLVADLTGASVLLYNTDGSAGAARGAGLGAGIFTEKEEAFRGMEVVEEINPREKEKEIYASLYIEWNEILQGELEKINK
ncbi:MAG: FGGY family carbohydrate kinase [Bacteroidales bacterium]|jgi:xylulokinase|nr:FGGY family carbohydrate kinase [Bacteroidales bacterium]